MPGDPTCLLAPPRLMDMPRSSGTPVIVLSPQLVLLTSCLLFANFASWIVKNILLKTMFWFYCRGNSGLSLQHITNVAHPAQKAALQQNQNRLKFNCLVLTFRGCWSKVIPQWLSVRLLLSFYSTEFILFIISVIHSIELYTIEFEHKAIALAQGFIQNSNGR